MEATMEQPETTQVPAAVHNILSRSICLVLHCGKVGNHRKVVLESAEVLGALGVKQAVDADEIGAQVRLFGKGDLGACARVIDSVKGRLRAISLDGGTRMFGTGTYLVPLGHVPAAKAIIAEAQAQLAEKVEELVARLPALVERRRAALGPMVDVKRFPTAQDVRAAFRIRYNFVSFGAPELLEEVSVAAYDEAVAQHNALLADAYQDVVQGLRESACLVLRELVEKLGANREGKPKALQPTALADLQALLQRLPVLNSVAEDRDLAAALARIGVLAEGLEVEGLRKAPGMRAVLLAEAEAAAAALDSLVTTGGRAVDLSEL